MPILTDEAQQLLETTYPADHSNIHGRLYAARITALVPNLVTFFKQNQELVPAKFQKELNELNDEELSNWQRVAILRASGRNTPTGFEDKNSGAGFAKEGAKRCATYLQKQGMAPSKATTLADAIIQADPEDPKTRPNTLLGWILKHGTQLETLRDQRNKSVKLSQLPSWQEAKTHEAKAKLSHLAQTHYQLIHQQQGFACVSLENEKGQKIYPTQLDQDDSVNVRHGKQQINRAGKQSSCFQDTNRAVNLHYQTTLKQPTIPHAKPKSSSPTSTPSIQSQTTGKSTTPVKIAPNQSFQYKPISTSPIKLGDIESELKKKNAPAMLSEYIKSPHEQNRQQAAQLLTVYSVKSILGDINSPMSIQKIENNQAGKPGHAKDAIKIRFSTPEAAAAFTKQLLEVHGIHSTTFGPGTPKTPQGTPPQSVFLTADDLEKITEITKISPEKGIGLLAYQVTPTTTSPVAQNIDTPADTNRFRR